MIGMSIFDDANVRVGSRALRRGTLCRGTVSRGAFCRLDTSPLGRFAVRTVRRVDSTPSRHFVVGTFRRIFAVMGHFAVFSPQLKFSP